MKSRIGLILLLGLLLGACTGPATLAASPTEPPGPAVPTGTLPPEATVVSPTGTATAQADAGANCASEAANQFGASIAASYTFTTLQEVMTWFCAGAEFEDILVALETEELAGEPAEDLLQMRADGLSWDEIWQVIGLYDQ